MGGWVVSKVTDLMVEHAAAVRDNDVPAQVRIVAQIELLTRPPVKTYFFAFTPEASLAVIEADMPQEDAIAETGKTIRLFGWREGILRVISVVEEYLKTGQLDNHINRIKLNSRPKQMPDGRIFQACAACSYSPEADKVMWQELIAAQDKMLAEPPEEPTAAEG